jgi:DNA-directed RNA polymerase specialized sigma24 family protein
MDKNKIITDIYLSKEVKALKQKLPINYADDIIQHVFLTIFELPEAKIFDLYNQNKLKHYIIRVIYNVSKLSQTNSFGRSYGREFITDELPEYFTEVIDEPDIESLKYYSKEMLTLYAELGSFTEISKLTQIPISSVRKGVMNAREQVKKYNDYLNNNIFK